jgi:hypothetical protein
MSNRRKGGGPTDLIRATKIRKAAAELRTSLEHADGYASFAAPETWTLQGPHLKEEIRRARLWAEALIALADGG